MRPAQIVAAVLSLSTLSAAWPEALGEIRAVQNVHALLYGRQDSSETAEPSATDAPRSTAASRASRASSGATASTDESSARETASATESDTTESDRPTDKDESTTAKITGSVKATGTKSGSRNKTKTAFGNDPAGGIQMVTPGVFDGTQYYKIGDWVEFAWNYTSLSITPTAIDVLASCSANQGTYTIAVNQSVQETGRVYWDTQAYSDSGKNPPLLTNMYTLIIYDAESSVTARAKPGYLQTYQQHIFGMYEKQPYKPWNEFTCVGCNSALSSHELSVIRIAAITGTTMLTSFLFFTYNFGLW